MATHEHNSEKFGYIDLDGLKGVQQALAKLGFDPGKADGIDGPKTQDAVRKFQANAIIKFRVEHGPISDVGELERILAGWRATEALGTEIDFDPADTTAPEAPGA